MSTRELLHNIPRSLSFTMFLMMSESFSPLMKRPVLELLIKNGARLATPGEFTKRAFLNGRIDLLRAEAVLDIIRAKTDRSARVAAKQLHGQLSEKVNELKDQLINMSAHIESFIDFAEDDSATFTDQTLIDECSTVINTIEGMLKAYEQGTILREGVHTVIVGKTNVGKSSLLNTLLNRVRAIVSAYPGTTRDALEELIEIDGILFRLVDTAGIIINPQHELDYLSVEKTRQHYEKGDLILFVVDGSRVLDEEDRSIYEKTAPIH